MPLCNFARYDFSVVVRKEATVRLLVVCPGHCVADSQKGSCSVRIFF